MASPPSNLKILIVDDETSSAETLAIYLREKGHQAVCAYTVREALSTIRNDSFNLILLDIVLPEVSGFEAIREIRKISAAPIVLMTGYLDQAIAEDAHLLGVKTVLQKPLDLAKLEPLIRGYASSG